MESIWNFFEVERNERGILERNIWKDDLVDVKKDVSGSYDLVMFTEAWIGRWDLFAYEVYGETELWWAVPVANDVMNVFVESSAGAILKVPKADRIIEWLRWR